MPKKQKAPKPTPHTNVVISHELRRDLYAALKKRAEIEKANGRIAPTSFGAWVREQAMEMIHRYR